MVRDMLFAYQLATQIKDQNGRLPLHIACTNESYMSASIVRMLLQKNPTAAQASDRKGLLPLHLCLMHNNGDSAYDIIDLLLDVYPKAAKIALGEEFLTSGEKEPELAVHLALRNTSIFADKIIVRVIEAYPEV
jgi:ankyrin repeat protein